MSALSNPFALTKAVDLNDRQIAAQFVPFAGGLSFANTTVPTPQVLLGSKGGGRTHLLRRLAFPLQLEKQGRTVAQDTQPDFAHVIGVLKEDGYLGVYLRASGLNGARFSGKGQESGRWITFFAHYFELWLCRTFLTAWCQSMLTFSSTQRSSQPDCGSDWASELEAIEAEMRGLDQKVNGAAYGGELPETKASPPGEMLLDLSRRFIAQYDLGEGFLIVFLVDEFENLTADQQEFVNTLIRERQDPLNYILGSRSHGIKSFATQAAGEVNRAGSEFDLLNLDEFYASRKGNYSEFVEQIVLSRLAAAGYDSSRDALRQALGERPSSAMRFMPAFLSGHRPYLDLFRKRLRDAFLSEDEIDGYVRLVDLGDPVLEKAALLRFYQKWSGSRSLSLHDLQLAVGEIASKGESASQFLGHRRRDLVAQLYRDYQLSAPVGSFDHLVACSGYVPRNLLILLKNIFRWAEFFGEEPFVGGSILSDEARRRGVLDSAEWFLQDTRPLGAVANDAATAIDRLGAFLRRLRFTDKPAESNCSWVALDEGVLPDRALRVLHAAIEKGAVLENSAGHVDRNSGVVLTSVGVHPMLSVKYDLGTARRGVTRLSTSEAIAIFDPRSSHADFDRVVSDRVSSMNAPFERSTSGQDPLF